MNSIEEIYKAESRRVFATLVRLLGDFELAEDSLHDAFASALEQWPKEGIPKNPRAWLISTARFKGIDTIRRRARLQPLVDQHAVEAEEPPEDVPDDQLRLIFTCCHPAIAQEAQVALTLREVCGLTTEEIARAFLTPAPTLAQRIVRAKAKIRDAGIPYRVPSKDDLPERLEGVLQVIYLVFTEGYAASSGESLTRADLSGEAIRLGRLVLELLPEPEVAGLLALMLLQESRRQARTDAQGELVILEDQDRSLWDRGMIEEGKALVLQSLRSQRFGPYTIQAAIVAVHADAASPTETDWAQIVLLYQMLLRMQPSPIVELNWAVAVAMANGPEQGLTLIDHLLARGELNEYHLAHAARGEFLSRLNRCADAEAALQKALELAQLEPEKRHLRKKIEQLRLRTESL